MEWIDFKKRKPSRDSKDLYLVTDGLSVGWCYFGCDDEGFEHEEFIGGDADELDYEYITHWMQIILPNSKKGKPSRFKEIL